MSNAQKPRSHRGPRIIPGSKKNKSASLRNAFFPITCAMKAPARSWLKPHHHVSGMAYAWTSLALPSSMSTSPIASSVMLGSTRRPSAATLDSSGRASAATPGSLRRASAASLGSTLQPLTATPGSGRRLSAAPPDSSGRASAAMPGSLRRLSAAPPGSMGQPLAAPRGLQE